MNRIVAALLLGSLGLGAVPAAQAEGGRKIPIARDLERRDRIDERLWRNGSLPLDVEETGSVGGPVANDRLSPYDRPRGGGDPSGVVGFSGPPGIIGDSVNSLTPLPPGSPANLDGRW